MPVLMVKTGSAHTKVSVNTGGGKPAQLVDAARLAETETGRLAFRKLFRISNQTAYLSLDEEIVRREKPSARWAAQKNMEMLDILGNESSYKPSGNQSTQEVAFLRGAQSQFTAFLHTYAPPSEVGELEKEYDDILDQDFDALQNICVDIQVLRQTFPMPTEKEWGGVADRLVNLAMRKWAWLLESPRLGEPPKQAMPYPYNGKPGDTQSLPNTFKPDRATSIPRLVANFGKLSPREKKCLTPRKNIPSNAPDCAYLPVLSVEHTADKADLCTAEGRSVYSAVQAAAISWNVGSEIHHLELSIAHGYVCPQSSRWAGEGSALSENYDILLCTGDTYDLGALADVISVYLMVYKAVRAHVAAAFDAPPEKLANGQPLSRPLPHVALRLKAGPLVDWRVKCEPRTGIPAKRKWRGNLKAPAAKRSKRDAYGGGRRTENEEGKEEEEDGNRADEYSTTSEEDDERIYEKNID